MSQSAHYEVMAWIARRAAWKLTRRPNGFAYLGRALSLASDEAWTPSLSAPLNTTRVCAEKARAQLLVDVLAQLLVGDVPMVDLLELAAEFYDAMSEGRAHEPS